MFSTYIPWVIDISLRMFLTGIFQAQCSRIQCTYNRLTLSYYFPNVRSPHSGKPEVSLSFEQRDRIRICWRIKSPRFVKESEPAAICFPVNKTIKLKRMNYKLDTWVTFILLPKLELLVLSGRGEKIRILKEIKKLTINLWKKRKTVNREYYAIERNSLPCMERYLITNQNFLLTPSHMNWNQKRVVLCHWGTLFGCRYRSMNKTAEIKLWRYRQLSHLRIL